MADMFSEYEEYTEPNWDGYGAAPISLLTVQAAREYAATLSPEELVTVDIAPGGDGSIGFEWRTDSSIRMVDVGPDGRIVSKTVKID